MKLKIFILKLISFLNFELNSYVLSKFWLFDVVYCQQRGTRG